MSVILIVIFCKKGKAWIAFWACNLSCNFSNLSNQGHALEEDRLMDFGFMVESLGQKSLLDVDMVHACACDVHCMG